MRGSPGSPKSSRVHDLASPADQARKLLDLSQSLDA